MVVPPITVLVADDEPMVRQALTDVLNDNPRIRVVASVGDAVAAIRRAGELHPDVAVLDVRMPGGGGAAAARGIRIASPRTRIFAHSACDDVASSNEMLAAGAQAYFVKGVGARHIVAGILAEDGNVA